MTLTLVDRETDYTAFRRALVADISVMARAGVPKASGATGDTLMSCYRWATFGDVDSSGFVRRIRTFAESYGWANVFRVWADVLEQEGQS